MEQHSLSKENTQSTENSSVQNWFAGGKPFGYDPVKRSLLTSSTTSLRVFLRGEGDLTHAVTFLPGYPDGSFGWSKVLPYLPDAKEMPKLFVEYVGMGDSDKPKDYEYSTGERTDLVEAVWRKLGVKSTTIVAFDFSSLVVLEHLQRRLEGAQRGESTVGPKIRGVFIFNGGLFTSGHTHPWYTTPVLRRLPDRAIQRMRSYKSFALMMKRTMWSKDYHITDAEIRELYDTVSLHDGRFYLAKAAGFVADHKAQGERLDFEYIFKAYKDQFPFLVGGSEKDPFEHRQVDMAEKLFGNAGLQIVRLPGGHMTTNEQPEALAKLITKFEKEIAHVKNKEKN